MAIVTRNIDGTTPWASTNNPNSCRITYGAGDTAANILAEVDAFITAHGWTAIATANSPITVRSYKALNYDGNSGGTGTNWKYIILDVASAGYLLCKVYESVTGTTGTNIAQQTDQTGYAQRLDVTNGGTLWITSNSLDTSKGISSSIIFYAQTPGGNGSVTGGSPNGCFEYQRTNPNHTIASGLPFHVGLNGYTTNTPNISHSKLLNGQTTSLQYSRTYSPDGTGFGYGGSAYGSTLPDVLTGKYKAMETIVTQWTSVPAANVAQYIVGPLRNMKLLSIGTIGDTVTLKINSQGWIDPAGTDMVFLVYPTVTSGGGIAVPV